MSQTYPIILIDRLILYTTDIEIYFYSKTEPFQSDVELVLSLTKYKFILKFEEKS